MALQNFVDKVGPVVSAAWLNTVDVIKFTIFGDASTKAQARTNLTSDLPLEIANGGTAARTAAAARTSLTADAPLEIVNGGTGQRTFTGLPNAMQTGGVRTAAEIAAGVTPSDYSYPPGNAFRYGAVGDGTTDDTAALQRMFSVTGQDWFIPNTTGGFKHTATLTIQSDGKCEGFLAPTTAIGTGGSAAQRLTSFAVIVDQTGGTGGRTIRGLKIQGSVSVRAAFVNGIRCDAYMCYLEDCYVAAMNYGLVVREWSVTVSRCIVRQCNYNLVGYQSNTLTLSAINSLRVNNCSFDGAITRAVDIGATDWSDSVAAGNTQGLNIYLGNTNYDGNNMVIDNVGAVVIEEGYFENSVQDNCITLGSTGSGDGAVIGPVEIRGCFFHTCRYAVKCAVGARGINMHDNFCSAITSSALYLVTDIYSYTYVQGQSAGSFGQGKEVHTGYRNFGAASVTFGGATIPHLNIWRGRQSAQNNDPGAWILGSQWQPSYNTIGYMNASSTGGWFYTTPTTGKAFTGSGNVITFTTPADVYAFNGGDRITQTGGGTGTIVTLVDYAAGTMIVASSSGTVSAAGNVSQNQASWQFTTTTTTGAAPASGTWSKGDICNNSNATVGIAKSWLCTVAGSPGTWVSTGNL